MATALVTDLPLASPRPASVDTTASGRALRGSARVRILGWFVVLLALAIGASLVVQRQVLLNRLSHTVDTELSVDASALSQQSVGGSRSVQALFDSYLRSHVAGPDQELLTLVAGRPYEASYPRPPYPLERLPAFVRQVSAVTSPTRGDFSTPAGAVRYLAVPVRQAGAPSGVFVAAAFTGPGRSQVDGDVAVAAALSLSLLLFMGLLAWLVAGRVLAPVRLMTDAARSITETDLTRRIPADGDDEVARLASTFNAMLDRLQSAFVSQRNFVSDAGHELRTPITVVRGHLELMGDDPQERAETMAIVSDELDRMTRMVDDLLMLARAERPGFLHLEPVDVADIPREVVAKVKAIADRRWSVRADGGVVTLADPQRLIQAVMNLVSNAVAHTTAGDSIEVGAAVGGGQYRLWVADTGTGVAEGDQQRIFERFARGSHRRRTNGAGLGLSIVKAIAEAHHGRVELQSEPGRGATFTLVLPVTTPEELP